MSLDIQAKDAEIQEFSLHVHELESKCMELEGLVQLLEDRNLNSEELFNETQVHLQRNLSTIATRNTKMEQEMSSLQTDLGQVQNEKCDLFAMNENLSNQVSDHLNTIKKLQDKEQDLLIKLDNSKRDLELAHNGMTAGKYYLSDQG